MIEKSRRKRFNTLKKNSYEYYHKKSYKNSKYSYTKIKILELDDKFDSNYFTNKHQKKSFDYSNSENKENIIDYSNQTLTLPSTENKNYKIKNIKKNYNKNIITNNKNNNNNSNNNINNLNSEKIKKNNNIIINIENKNINYKNELNDNKNSNNLSQSEYSDEFSEEFGSDNIENNDDNDNNNKINENNNNNNLLNISTQEIKDAYYYPKKLQYVKNMFFSQKMMQFNLINNFINNNNNSINRVNSMNEKILYKNNNFFNSDSLENKLPINNNNSNFILSPIHNKINNNKNNINLFNLYETNIIPSNSNSNTSMPSLNLNLNKNINNVFIGNTYYDSSGNNINNCIINNSLEFYHKKEKEKENTDILCINIKINNNEILVFKIRRYDDMFKTVKIFCEINKLDTKYIKPLIIYIIRALNSIYGIYNLSLNENEIKFIEDLREKNSIKNDSNNKNTSTSYENDNNQNIIDYKKNESDKICKN